MIKKLIKKIDQILDKNLNLLFLLLLLVILRIPNFFEPYWYGDEAIYLTLGNSLRQGAKLYTDIIDHKTPIIYYLAMVSTQLNFRILLFFWMLVTTIFFYKLAKKILINKHGATIASFIFVILSTVPWLEGNIPNGELFVMGFIIVGAYFLSLSNYFVNFFNHKKKTADKRLFFFLAGVFFGLGILTKVPAIFDLAAFLSFGYFITSEKLIEQWQKKTKLNKAVFKNFLQSLTLLLISFLPIILSIIYFVAIGSGRDYLDYGLLYNFRYSQSYVPSFNNWLLSMLFTLKGKLFVLIISFIGLTLVSKKVSRVFLFALSWFLLALFASLLSNRPYPHYYLQIVPAFSLLITVILLNLYKILKNKSQKLNKQPVLETLIGSFFLYLLLSILIQLKVGFYPVFNYYQKFIKKQTGLISQTQYEYSFNHLVEDNYQAMQIIKTSGAEDFFIWGNNPLLYALSKNKPVGRFTVAFHIHDFKAYQETMKAVREAQPKIIIVMNGEKTFTELEQYLHQYYLPNTSLKHMIIYLRKK